MQFLSLQFIVFFSFIFWSYWALFRSKNGQNVFLLIASYSFYAFIDWRCCGLLFLTSFTTFIAGLFLYSDDSKLTFLKKGKRWWISCGSIVLNLFILFYFKYFNFFINSISLFVGRSYETLNIILPVGISFYTFSAISYVVDSYQRKLMPTKDIVAGLLYCSFFPAILSGPIHKATEQLPQYLIKREFNTLIVVEGFKDFLWGAFMKLCVADRLGLYVDAVFNNLELHNGTSILFASVFYTIQIYADFAGYSLLAIGCGKMLGIKLQTNFIRPYFSKTITEFWSKWHMSLTSWFKNYVYFPLGGNRVSKPRWVFNIMVVFLLSGIWHGAAYTFIIWGAIHGTAQIFEKLAYGKKIKTLPSNLTIENSLRILITFFIISFAWLFFRLPTMNASIMAITKIFSSCGFPYLDKHTLIFGIISLLILIVKDVCDEWYPKVKFMHSSRAWVNYLVCILLTTYILLMGKLNSESFIYFQF